MNQTQPPETECCPSPAGPTIDDLRIEAASKAFKALGDPTRLRLMTLIAASPAREACICDLTDPVGLSQPTVSHHMKQLMDAGLATREQRGRWAYYAVSPDGLRAIRDTLGDLASLGRADHEQ